MDKKASILVVDEYRTMLQIVSNLLRQLGFENVDQATDGEAALRALKEKTFGLVISDWNMQPMSGLELLRHVRADPALSGLPFIMITADGRTENLIAATEAGASNYIIKPFSAGTLQIKIGSVLHA